MYIQVYILTAKLRIYIYIHGYMHTLRLLNARAGVYTVNYDNSNNGKYRNKEQSGSERAGDRAGWGES